VSPEHEAMFSAEDLLSYKRQFAAFDADGGGSVDEHELGAMLAKMGAEVPTAQLKELIAEVDVDGNGEMDFDEFLSMFSSARRRQVLN